MNNADMPAIPNSILTNAVLPDGHIEPYVKTDGGLTKREYIAPRYSALFHSERSRA